MKALREVLSQIPQQPAPSGHWCVTVKPWTEDSPGRFSVQCRACNADGMKPKGPRFKVLLAVTGTAVPCVDVGERMLWFPDEGGGRVAVPQQTVRPPVIPPRMPIGSCGPITKRNLLYHVYPAQGDDIWRKNVRQIVRRISLFNGRRLIGVAAGPGLEPMAEVRAEFEGESVELVPISNAPIGSDCTTLRCLLPALYSLDANEATFFAHTKGASQSRRSKTGVTYWRNALYHHLLDDWPAVEQALQRHACAGGCKVQSNGVQQFSTGLYHGTWHYAGTFFWLRHDQTFGHPRWWDIPFDRYGAEAYVGGLFQPEEGATLYQPPVTVPLPENVWYHPENHPERIDDPLVSIPKIHIGSGITVDYITKARPFLESLNRSRQPNKFIVTLGFSAMQDLRATYPSICFTYRERDCVENHGMIQHGPWLDACPWIKDDDLCVFTDSDITIQRPISQSEALRFACYGPTMIGLGLNAGTWDNLALEAERIGFRDPYGVYRHDEWQKMRCHNCGVIVARAGLFRRLRRLYDAEAPRFYAWTAKRSRCQWLINYLVHQEGWPIDLLGPEIHSNGHFTLQPGCRFDDEGRMFYRDRLVMFRHTV